MERNAPKLGIFQDWIRFQGEQAAGGGREFLWEARGVKVYFLAPFRMMRWRYTGSRTFNRPYWMLRCVRMDALTSRSRVHRVRNSTSGFSKNDYSPNAAKRDSADTDYIRPKCRFDSELIVIAVVLPTEEMIIKHFRSPLPPPL